MQHRHTQPGTEEQADGTQYVEHRQVAVAIVQTVGTARDNQQPDDPEDIRHRRHKAGDQVRAAELLDQRRQPQAQPVDAQGHRQVEQRQQQHALVLEGMQRIAVAGLAVGLQVLGQFAGEPGFFVFAHPVDLLGAVRQVAQHRPGEQDRRGADDDEQPLPAVQPEGAVHAQQAAGDRAGDHHCDRLREDKQPEDLAAMAHREPLGDVVQNAGEEPGLGRAEQKAHHIEALRPLHERHADGDGAPGDHDPCEPAPCAEAIEHQVAGDLEQEIANEEQACAKAVGRITDADVGAHVQLGEPHGGAVHVGDQVQQDEEGNQFQRDAPYKPQFLAHGVDLRLLFL